MHARARPPSSQVLLRVFPCCHPCPIRRVSGAVANHVEARHSDRPINGLRWILLFFFFDVNFFFFPQSAAERSARFNDSSARPLGPNSHFNTLTQATPSSPTTFLQQQWTKTCKQQEENVQSQRILRRAGQRALSVWRFDAKQRGSRLPRQVFRA